MFYVFLHPDPGGYILFLQFSIKRFRLIFHIFRNRVVSQAHEINDLIYPRHAVRDVYTIFPYRIKIVVAGFNTNDGVRSFVIYAVKDLGKIGGFYFFACSRGSPSTHRLRPVVQNGIIIGRIKNPFHGLRPSGFRPPAV